MKRECLNDWCKKIGICLLLMVLLFFYIPNINIVHEELPKLQEWEMISPDVIKTTLPEAFEEGLTICFWTDHHFLSVYLEEEEIYNGQKAEELSFSEVPASKWNRIEIPAESSGKELRIFSESGTIPFVKEYVYGTNEQINEWLHQHYGFTQLVDVGIVGIGILLILIGIYNRKRSLERELPQYLGCAFILIGMYLRVTYKSIPIHWMTSYTCEFISYFTFYTVTIPLLAYIRKKERVSGWFDQVCKMVSQMQLLFVIVIFTLHGLGSCDVSRFMWVGSGAVMAMIILSGIGTILVALRGEKKVTILSAMGSVLLLLMALLEWIRIHHWFTFITQPGTIIRISVLLIMMTEILSSVLNIQELAFRKRKAEEENEKLEFQLLSSQIRPHFILNTLGAIRSMVSVDAERASDLLWDFSKYLRSNIEEKDYMKPIPFLEELDYIETYLRLEQTRFGERLKVEYDIQAIEFWVLPLTIQPFVENAVKHGLFSSKNGGTVRIGTREDQGKIVVEIQDNGSGFEVEKLPEILKEKKSVGLRSAIYRIENGMNGVCKITGSESGQGTLVNVILEK